MTLVSYAGIARDLISEACSIVGLTLTFYAVAGMYIPILYQLGFSVHKCFACTLSYLMDVILPCEFGVQ